MGFAVNSFAALVPFLVGGFIVGRAVHSVAVSFQWLLGRVSHREAFKRELSDPTHLSAETVDEFYERCKVALDTAELPSDREAVVEDDTDPDGAGSGLVDRVIDGARSVFPSDSEEHAADLGDTLYVLVRAYVHIDGTGRSRTFQAVHAFYRSTEVVSVLLVGIYSGYSLKKLSSAYLVDAPALLPYTTIVDHLGFEPEVIALGSIFLAIVSWKTFSTAKHAYRRYYLQYLVMDFLLLMDTDAGPVDTDAVGGVRGPAA